MKKYAWLVVVAILVLVPLLAACAAPAPTPTPTPTPTPAVALTYVGSEVCKTCHSDKYSGWQGTLHSKMIQDAKAKPTVIIGDWDTPSEVRTFTKDDVVYTIGSKWKQRYLTKIGDDYYILPAQWIVATQEWKAYHADDWQERPWSKKCQGCHTTGYELATKTHSEIAIGCEACHGPGSQHAVAGDKTKIVNPADLSPELRTAVCGQCHTRGKDAAGTSFPVGYTVGEPIPDTYTTVEYPDKHVWPDGSAAGHHQQYLDWLQSKHATKGITCSSCHDSHLVTNAMVKKAGAELCKTCHADKADLAAHTPYMANIPVSCIECHMPKIAKSAVKYDIRSHTFWPPDPAKTVEHEIPNACNICHQDKTPEWSLEALGK